MAFKIRFAAQAERDFELIFDFLVESYQEFGDDIETSMQRAEQRLDEIYRDIESLSANPFRGTLHEDLLPGLRHITLGRAIIWFDVAEREQQVRVLAIFFGGQDHIRHMLVRLMSAL